MSLTASLSPSCWNSASARPGQRVDGADLEGVLARIARRRGGRRRGTSVAIAIAITAVSAISTAETAREPHDASGAGPILNGGRCACC